MKTSTEGIDFFEKGNPEQKDPLEFRNQDFPPYSPSKISGRDFL
jgi:hypothetical protein